MADQPHDDPRLAELLRLADLGADPPERAMLDRLR